MMNDANESLDGVRLAPGDAAPDVEVRLTSGQSSTLSRHWRERPLLLAFTRHLGCAFCREQLLDLKDHWASFQDGDVQVLGVTMRPIEATSEFRRQLDLPFELIADPQRTVYRAYGAERGNAWRVLGLGVWPRAIGATWRGGMGLPQGDIMQLHASFLIDRSGVIQLAHYPRTSADQLSCAQCLETIEGT